MSTLKHISLFTGCMGFDLAAEWAGIDTVATCENEPYLQAIIRQKYEGRVCIHHDDVTTFNHKIYADIISAGFPCTEVSGANPTAKGINGGQTGLWRHIIRICGQNRPPFVLLENSPKILIRGVGELLQSFSQIGYVCEWQCVHSSDFGFPDKRERWFCIAYPFSFGLHQTGVFTGYSIKDYCKERYFELVPFCSTVEEYESCVGEPAIFGSDPGVPDGDAVIKALGNAVNPFVAGYFFNVIKRQLAKLS